MLPVIWNITQNSLVILSFVFLFGMFLPRLNRLPHYVRNAIFGVMFGAFGIMNMISPFRLASGIIIDIRNPFIAVAGVYGGGIAATVSAAMIGAYRWFVIGGAGAPSGTVAIFFSIFVGVYWYYRRQQPQSYNWLLMGFVTVLINIATAIFFIAPDMQQTFFRNFIPIAALLYPLGTLALGELLAWQQNKNMLAEQVKLSEQRFRAIFNQSFQFVGLSTPGGRLIDANESAIKFTELPLRQIQKLHLWELPVWTNETAEREGVLRVQQAVQAAANGEFVRYRTVVKNPSGRQITIDFSITPLKNDEGKVILLIPEGRDITAELEAEQNRFNLALEQERTLILQQFIEDSSHHLRTPITLMRTSTYLLDRALSQVSEQILTAQSELRTGKPMLAAQTLHAASQPLERARERIPTLDRSIDRLIRLVDDLLRLTSLEKQDAQERQLLDMTPYLMREVGRYVPVAEQKSLTLTFEPESKPITLLIDPNHLELIMQNLLENAIRYTPEGGSITLKTQIEGANAQIIVEDSGIGIPPEDLPHIFERFYRSDNAQSFSSDGTGLGLPIIYKMAKMNGGNVTVRSEVGRGTCFTVTLPLHAASLPHPSLNAR